MSARGERTREHLIDVAEQLFGERGVDGVSLREIRLAAGQRNVGALQYHFEDRDGLLAAITDRHLPRIAVRHLDLLERLPADRRLDPRSLVEVIIRPAADYLELGPSERAWTKICAEMGPSPRTAMHDLIQYAPPAARAAGGNLYRRLLIDLPEPLALERMLAVMHTAVHICADRARLLDASDLRRPLPSGAVFVANLVDMTCAALLAPVSPALHDALGGTEPFLDAAEPKRTSARPA